MQDRGIIAGPERTAGASGLSPSTVRIPGLGFCRFLNLPSLPKKRDCYRAGALGWMPRQTSSLGQAHCLAGLSWLVERSGLPGPGSSQPQRWIYEQTQEGPACSRATWPEGIGPKPCILALCPRPSMGMLAFFSRAGVCSLILAIAVARPPVSAPCPPLMGSVSAPSLHLGCGPGLWRGHLFPISQPVLTNLGFWVAVFLEVGSI